MVYMVSMTAKHRIRADSRLAPCQWETSLQSNAVSHWIGANLDSARADSGLAPSQWETSLQSNAVSHWLGANLESAYRIDLPAHLCGITAWIMFGELTGLLTGFQPYRHTEAGRSHDMETFSVLLVLCKGIPLVIGGFPLQMTSYALCGALMFPLLLAWTSFWTDSWVVDILRRLDTHMMSL